MTRVEASAIDRALELTDERTTQEIARAVRIDMAAASAGDVRWGDYYVCLCQCGPHSERN